MHLPRRHRIWIACIVSCAMLLAAFAPALRHAAARTAIFAEVCGAGGVRVVRLDGATKAPGKGAHHHCLYCPGEHTPDGAPPAQRDAALAQAAGPARDLPADAPTPIATPGSAWPRAPPA
jgi:hypothetical protein